MPLLDRRGRPTVRAGWAPRTSATLRPEPGCPRAAAALWIFQPLERFLHVQAASGIVLLIATAVALAWANSPWAASYERLWHTPVRLGVGSYVVERDLHFLDQRRADDDLLLRRRARDPARDPSRASSQPVLKRAVLPVAAALGGMLFPALIYLALNPSPPERSGWGVPMATDIAFAVGALALLGNRVPAALRVLLLALAIIDDIGAILVIAIFYSSSISVAGFGLVALGIAGVLALQRFGVRSPAVYARARRRHLGRPAERRRAPHHRGCPARPAHAGASWFGEEGFLAEARGRCRTSRRRATGGHDARELTGPLAAARAGAARGAAARREPGGHAASAGSPTGSCRSSRSPTRA